MMNQWCDDALQIVKNNTENACPGSTIQAGLNVTVGQFWKIITVLSDMGLVTVASHADDPNLLGLKIVSLTGQGLRLAERRPFMTGYFDVKPSVSHSINIGGSNSGNVQQGDGNQLDFRGSAISSSPVSHHAITHPNRIPNTWLSRNRDWVIVLGLVLVGLVASIIAHYKGLL